MERQGDPEDRQCVRVAVPEALFVEAALWVKPPHVPTRLSLAALGRPQLRLADNPRGLRIEDISANGLRLTLPRPAELGDAAVMLSGGPCLVFLYFKLNQPLTAVADRPLTLFLGAEPVAVRPQDDGSLVVTLNIVYRGQPNRDEKSLTFFYVARYPIRDLAAWCDEVTLMDRAQDRPAARGLRMDRFLLELDAELERARAAADKESAN